MAPKPKEERESSETCTASKKDGSPCMAYPLSGKDKCRVHAGTDSTGSSHEDNQNAQTHGLFSAHDGYYHSLPDDEQEWLFDFTNVLLDRVRANGGDPDMFDREALKNIAIDFHRVAHANGWFREQGLIHQEVTHSESFSKEETKINVWASEIRQYSESIYRRMQKHGILDDPESQMADATRDLAGLWAEDLE